MVLQTERFNGGYQQQSYSAYQGSNGGYKSYQSVTDYSTPYSSTFQVPTYPLTHGSHHQSGWTSGGHHYGNGANHSQGGGMGFPVKPSNGGFGSFHKHNSYTHEYSDNHGNSHYPTPGNHHGSPPGRGNHQGHGSPPAHGNHQGYSSPSAHGNHQGYSSPPAHGNHQGYSSPPAHGNHQGYSSPPGHGNHHDFEKTHGFGGVPTPQINKPTHGNNNYGNTNPNYGNNPSNFNLGYNQKPSWTFKSIDDDDE